MGSCSGGDLLTVTADAGVVTARRDPGGMVTLPASGYITIPAALRRRCGLEVGDQVLLAALLVLKSMGLSPEDLLASSNRPPVPTFAEYVNVVSATVTAASLRAYRPYWNRTVAQWGERRLDEPTPSEVKQLVAYVKANAVQRRNGRGGHNAAENLISALRCLYRHAVDDGLIEEKGQPRPQGRQAPPPAAHPPGASTSPASRRLDRRAALARRM